MKFIKLVLSENGEPSSKRVIAFILVALFCFEFFFGLFTGKEPSPTLRDQLFYSFLYVVTMIFGSNIADIWKQGPTAPTIKEP